VNVQAASTVDQPEASQATGALIERDCPHCGGQDFDQSKAYSRDQWRVGSCGGCAFVFLQNVPVYDRMVEEFAWENTFKQEKERRVDIRPVSTKASTVLRKIRKPFRTTHKDLIATLFKPGPVLDVGCGHGVPLPEGMVPHGIELSKGLFEIANKNMQKLGGYAVHAPAVEGIAQFEAGKFTGIILRSFLEHEWQPKELLKGAHRVLADDGGVFIRVPNFASLNRKIRGNKWCGFRYPDHVNYFTPNSLQKMARQCGFNMKLLNPLKISIDDNIKAVLTKRAAENSEGGVG